MTETAQELAVFDPWGARAGDWAEIEDENSRQLFEAVLAETGLDAGEAFLDVGCGSGLACEVASQRGARVAGLDASQGLIDFARGRVPAGDLRVGDMTDLPWPDASFDVVTFVNTFFFASDRERTLAEAARVTRAGGRVAVVAWTSPDAVDLTKYLGAVGPLLPPSPVEVDPFIAPHELERLAGTAGMRPARVVPLDWSWEYPDRQTMLRGLLSPGLSVLAVEAVGEAAVRDAIVRALEPLALAGGGYRVENSVHCLIATKPAS